MRAAKTPIERLEFGLRWEAYRLAYFSSIGHSTKVAALTAKLQRLEETCAERATSSAMQVKQLSSSR